MRSARSGQVGPFGLVLRLFGGMLLVGFVWLLVQAMASEGGRPGSLIVTLIFVFVGIALQYVLGLGLALLAVQQVPWRRFFRIVFLIPLTITPVGVGYMFLMLTDTSKGPLEPIWVALGLRDFTWVTDPWLARAAVIIGDTWQWTPFVFIVLLAALESLDQEVREAALADGASRWQSFRHITFPAILPVTTTIVLIRLIEGFKIIDMPNILLGGGPGTATQSMTLQAYIDWNTLNLGRSAAVAYLLLILVTVVATVYVSLVRRRVTERRMTNPFRRRSATDLSPPAKFVAFLLLLAWALVVLFPIYWLIVTSFKTPVRRRQGPVLRPVRRFPADPRCVALHPRRARQRHAAALRQHGHRRPDSARPSRCVMGSFTAYALVRFTYRPKLGLIGARHRLHRLRLRRGGARRAASRSPSRRRSRSS